jgi:hypothetical protein
VLRVSVATTFTVCCGLLEYDEKSRFAHMYCILLQTHRPSVAGQCMRAKVLLCKHKDHLVMRQCTCAQVFFCKYNDPIYVKLEKLDIMIALANERNIDQVLLELKEYATEVDVDFVRKVGRPTPSDTMPCPQPTFYSVQPKSTQEYVQERAKTKPWGISMSRWVEDGGSLRQRPVPAISWGDGPPAC